MFRFIVFDYIIKSDAELEEQVELDDRAKEKDGVLAAQGKIYGLERIFLIAVWEDFGEAVGYEWEFEVAEAYDGWVDIEVDGILPDSADAYDLY